MSKSADASGTYWPRAMTPNSTSRMIIMIFMAALIGSAIGGALAHYFDTESLDIFRKSGAFGGMMLTIAAGAHRW